MALLYQPPKLPYSGTDLGLGSNVFCKKILTANILDGGPGASLSDDGVDATIQADWATATFAAGTYSTQVTSSSTTGAGTGMTATFSFTLAGGEIDAAKIALSAVVTNPGSGYVSGEVVTWDTADILAKFQAGTTPPSPGAAVYSNVNSAYTLTLGAGSNATSAVIYTEVGSSGWQFTLGGVSGQVQLVTIIIADDGIAGNDYADRDYVVVTNITGGVPETDTTTAGIASASIFHNTDNKTEQITLRRSVGDRGSASATLAAADVTVRLSKRQLQQ